MTFHAPTGPVPPTDSAANTDSSYVLGSKLDTVAGTSVYSRILQALANLATLLGYHPVPATDTADNGTVRDVVGSKLDRTYNGGNSIYAEIHTLAEHNHSRVYVLPDRATDITATAGNGWAFGVASASLGTPGDDFDVHWVEIVADDNAQYQAQILVDGVAVTEFAFERIGVQSRSINTPVQMAVTAAGPITIKLASSTNGATASFKVEYHLY